MNETAWNWLAWGSFAVGFFAREIPALFRRAPWQTMSECCWDAEADWRPAALLFALAGGWLVAHIASRGKDGHG